MKRKTQIFLAIFAVAITAFFISRNKPTSLTESAKPSDAPIDEITAGYLPMVSSLTYFVAEEKGYFAKQRLKVKARPLPTSNAIAEDLLRGNIDVAIELSVVPLITADDGKLLYRIFSTSKITGEEGMAFDGVIVREDSPIKELKDLAGKKVTVFPGTTAERTFASVFHGLYPDLLMPTFTPKVPAQHLQSLLNGESDALHAYEPFLSEGIVEHKCRKIYGSVYWAQTTPDPSPIGVGAVNSRWLAENPETARRFFAAIDEAVAFIEKDLEQSREILARWTDKSVRVTSRMNIMPMSPSASLDRKALQRYIVKLVEMNEIKAAPAVDSISISNRK